MNFDKFDPFKFTQLEEEIRRLFPHMGTEAEDEFRSGSLFTQPNTDFAYQGPQTSASRDDVIPFHLNGIDTEYCPELENKFRNSLLVRKKDKKKKGVSECVFCKNNNEPPKVYRSHVLKDPLGRTTCPILRKYTCPVCLNPGGDMAHTIKYCPLQTRQPGSIPSAASMLRTPRTSTGLRRIRSNSSH